MNLINYIRKYGNKSFVQSPFCDADALVFARLSYVNWEKTLDENDHDSNKVVKMRDFASPAIAEDLTKEDLDHKEIKAILVALANSKRFKHVRVGNVKRIFDEENAIQFCSMAFFSNGMEPIVAIRGTDTSLVGWKEDLSLAFKKELPGQIEALKYVEKFAEHYGTDFKIVGHSKGGNFAAYCLYKMSEYAFSKLTTLYNLDGPGFLDPDSTFDKKLIEERTCKMKKFVPSDSLIGILLKQTSDYVVVESYKMLASQHNPTNWKINEKTHSLLVSKYRTSVSKNFEQSTTEWIDNTPPEDIAIASSYIIEFLGGYNNNVLAILGDIPKTYRDFAARYRNEKPEVQTLVKKTFLGLLVTWRQIVLGKRKPAK